uniref:000C19H04 n=1 Tax=Arabidopsis thaliana TaxID=3702 RepID=Q9FPG3_ARATH|nr:000C19H04 [Arabidopsis thaliana]
MNNSPSNGDDSMPARSLTFVIIPLICVLSLSVFISLLYYRRRRRLRTEYRDWPRRHVAPDGHVMTGPRRGRWNVLGGLASREGLNELGEAPPPYDPKKNTDGDLENGGGNSRVGESELAHHPRDAENGVRPPEYLPRRSMEPQREGITQAGAVAQEQQHLTVPPPAVTSDAARRL